MKNKTTESNKVLILLAVDTVLIIASLLFG